MYYALMLNRLSVYKYIFALMPLRFTRSYRENKPKSACRVPFGHYQFRVFTFSLTNAPGCQAHQPWRPSAQSSSSASQISPVEANVSSPLLQNCSCCLAVSKPLPWLSCPRLNGQAPVGMPCVVSTQCFASTKCLRVL